MAEMLLRPSLRFEIEREGATRSLREFVRQAWHVMDPATPFVPAGTLTRSSITLRQYRTGASETY